MPHPATRSTGDVDKHARMTLDDGDVYKDDSRVVLLLGAKAWAEEPGRERAVVFVTPAHPNAARELLSAMITEAQELRFEEAAS